MLCQLCDVRMSKVGGGGVVFPYHLNFHTLSISTLSKSKWISLLSNKIKGKRFDPIVVVWMANSWWKLKFLQQLNCPHIFVLLPLFRKINTFVLNKLFVKSLLGGGGGEIKGIVAEERKERVAFCFIVGLLLLFYQRWQKPTSCDQRLAAGGARATQNMFV